MGNSTVNWVELIFTTGGVLLLREVIGGLIKMSRGVAGTITKRRTDIVGERDAAVDAKAVAEADSIRWQKNWQNQYVYSGKLEHMLAVAGISNTAEPPEFEQTQTKAQVRKIVRDAGNL